MARLAMRDGWVEARQGYKGTAFPVWYGEEPQGAVPAGESGPAVLMVWLL